MKPLIAGLSLLLIGLLTSACAGDPITADRSWPAYQSSLGQRLSGDFDSWSKVKAEFPSGTHIVPPAKDTPEETARLSGKWAGWYCENRNTDLKFVVEEVTKDGASIDAYFGGYVSVSHVSFTVHPIGGGEFEGTYSGLNDPLATVLLRLRSVEGVDVLDLKRTRMLTSGGFSAGSICAGVLKKVSDN